jgi:hypothetical protein
LISDFKDDKYIAGNKNENNNMLNRQLGELEGKKEKEIIINNLNVSQKFVPIDFISFDFDIETMSYIPKNQKAIKNSINEQNQAQVSHLLYFYKKKLSELHKNTLEIENEEISKTMNEYSSSEEESVENKSSSISNYSDEENEEEKEKEKEKCFEKINQKDVGIKIGENENDANKETRHIREYYKDPILQRMATSIRMAELLQTNEENNFTEDSFGKIDEIDEIENLEVENSRICYEFDVENEEKEKIEEQNNKEFIKKQSEEKINNEVIKKKK